MNMRSHQRDIFNGCPAFSSSSVVGFWRASKETHVHWSFHNAASILSILEGTVSHWIAFLEHDIYSAELLPRYLLHRDRSHR